jgi:carbon-monoxide dehydrogenase medium subunit
VDISELKELGASSEDEDTIRLGALTRHRELLKSEVVRTRLPLLTKAAMHIGHVGIRNRGTLGGSLAYADPAAELPACAVALGGSLLLGSSSGEREVKAEDFFKGLFETDLRPGELILGVRFPAIDSNTATAFAELARRHGDFALVGVAAVAKTDGNRINTARLVYFGCVERAALARSVSAAVAGLALPVSDNFAFEKAVREDLNPDDTPGLRASTKLHMATVLTHRALNQLAGEIAA